VSQVKVRWSAMSDELATWEDLEALKHQFPAAPSWVKQVSRKGGCANNANKRHSLVKRITNR
jgi:hypothetical protein